MAENTCGELKDPGRSLFVASADYEAGHRRIVIREHEFGMSRSMLVWSVEETRWRTVSHVVKLFQEAA